MHPGYGDRSPALTLGLRLAGFLLLSVRQAGGWRRFLLLSRLGAADAGAARRVVSPYSKYTRSSGTPEARGLRVAAGPPGAAGAAGQVSAGSTGASEAPLAPAPGGLRVQWSACRDYHCKRSTEARVVTSGTRGTWGGLALGASVPAGLTRQARLAVLPGSRRAELLAVISPATWGNPVPHPGRRNKLCQHNS